MILAMSLGNTNLIIAVKKGNKLCTKRSLIAKIDSKEACVSVVAQFLNEIDLKNSDITGAAISSVVKNNELVYDAVSDLFGITPLIVNAQMNMRLDLSNYDTALIGADRIAVCSAAIVKYDLPAVVFDFGTATTVNVIDERGCFLGGAILPGVMMGLNALANDTTLLPIFDDSPMISPIIGKNTAECMAAGALFGNAAMLDGMTLRIESEIGCKPGKISVIATGGGASHIMRLCRRQVTHDAELLVEGLFELYRLHNTDIMQIC